VRATDLMEPRLNSARAADCSPQGKHKKIGNWTWESNSTCSFSTDTPALGGEPAARARVPCWRGVLARAGTRPLRCQKLRQRQRPEAPGVMSEEGPAWRRSPEKGRPADMSTRTGRNQKPPAAEATGGLKMEWAIAWSQGYARLSSVRRFRHQLPAKPTAPRPSRVRLAGSGVDDSLNVPPEEAVVSPPSGVSARGRPCPARTDDRRSGPQWHVWPVAQAVREVDRTISRATAADHPGPSLSGGRAIRPPPLGKA
jgi:hypothetical protein